MFKQNSLGREWARDWMFKRTVADLQELINLTTDPDALKNLNRAQAMILAESILKPAEVEVNAASGAQEKAPGRTEPVDRLDFRGKWRTRGGKTAEIVDTFLAGWTGNVDGELCFWDKYGLCPDNCDNDLMELVRPGAYAKKLF